jgi:predicted glycosyltransferase
MIEEYRFPRSIASKIRFTGYLDQRRRTVFEKSGIPDPLIQQSLPDGEMILCLLGGGQDGDTLADAFSQAEFPLGYWGCLVTGPFMSVATRTRLFERAAANPHLRILDFINEPTMLVKRAERVIEMGGYNTICEVLSFGKRALIVPRTKPRREQILRALRLQKMGLIDVLERESVTPKALLQWLSRDLRPPEVKSIDLRGLDRLPGLAAQLLGSPKAGTSERSAGISSLAVG